VAVVGQGHVGLSVACATAKEGFKTVGIETDVARRDELQRGILSVVGLPQENFREALTTGLLTITSDLRALDGSGVIVICVPTPLQGQAPDLSHLERACDSIAPILTPGCLVVV
jgi:UDP-N-acetyl-D-mannosaminuronate dehydrogenase